MAGLPGAIAGARIVGERFAHSRRRQNPESRMPLLDHLRELRHRVDLREGLGPEFTGFEVEDLNPKSHYIREDGRHGVKIPGRCVSRRAGAAAALRLGFVLRCGPAGETAGAAARDAGAPGDANPSRSLPHPSRPGARRSTVQAVKARMAAIRGLGRQLARDGIEVVTLESTSDYWRIWFFVLEACGLAVQLVNASQAKNLPGRPKTDPLTELTAAVSHVSGQVVVWLATVARHDHRRRCAAGLVPAGGAAARVA
jgi:hypothetical protein